MFHPGGAGRGTRKVGEQGETLIEIIATVFLLGVVIVGLMTALLNVIISSDNNRRHVGTGNVAASMAELIRSATYQPCTGTSAPTSQTAFYTTAAGAASRPSNYTYAVNVQLLKSRTAAATPGTPAVFQANCPGSDQGAQKVTVSVTVTGRSTITESVVVIIRKRT
jgi:Tfp pilus assembly protein PilV